MRKEVLWSLPLLFLLACDERDTQAATKAPAPDNTAANARDRSGETLTPMDQAANAADVGLTKEIRQTLLDDETLSMNAHNVKVITVNGKVTLRGVVDSEAEKASVEGKVKGVTGVSGIDNQLEVKPN